MYLDNMQGLMYSRGINRKNEREEETKVENETPEEKGIVNRR